ncbi:serine hydrolase [Empedobacter falsenii]|uniref:serine hydrolase domain-containing protein n=1 Tax=Empedobacter falsenii TaxID=343874 RepID=UPI0025788502|nr:serine hydrolase [Empedobacter falsenii]MDM1298826.1 serine hydrolase [Empedobacter falsenii]MDM1318564.1 serine hydrolase [Empedobacter falsenii]
MDKLAEEAIANHYTPGIQILVAKEGKIVYDKSFGTQDKNSSKKVKWTDLYDVASVTKVTATLPLLMLEVNEGKLNLDQTIGEIDNDAKNSNKSSLKVREVLAHQAGLKPWIGFYNETVNVKNARLYLDFYSRKQDEEHQIKVTDNIYIINSIKDTIYEDIYKSSLSRKSYEYSDLGYYIFKKKLEKDFGKDLNQLTQEKFYQSLGMYRTTFNPKEKFSLEDIIPTEYDKTYRNQLIHHGFVHDQGAAMMGGIAGHAGLFSNSIDLAKLMQMYLNGGEYGDEVYLKPETVAEFTKQQFKGNHRGAGFDKMQTTSRIGPSAESFGHTGFTGTMVWADPKYNIVYIFLSNRVNETVEPNYLFIKKVRENIRQVIYEAILP